MTTFDAGPEAAHGTRPPGWLLSILVDGRSSDHDAIFIFHEDPTVDPPCMATARRFVDQTLGSWGAGRMAFDMSLVVCELVTNAMRHGGGANRLRLLRHQNDLACVISDRSQAPPVASTADLFAEYGRGLRLVDALCTGWGWLTPGGGGKHVWAVLPAY